MPNQDEPQIDLSSPEVPDAADFAPSPPQPKGPLQSVPSFDRAMPAVFCFAIFVACSMTYWQSPWGILLPVSKHSIIERHEYWRCLTALFTHGDFAHLLSNAPLFIIFGWFLRAFFGFGIFPILALLIGAATNLLTILFMPSKVNLVGASGMLYAMVGLWLVFYIRFANEHSVGMRFFRAAGFSLLLLFPTTFSPTTSYLAHGIGFALGLASGIAMLPFIEVHQPNDEFISQAEGPTPSVSS